MPDFPPDSAWDWIARQTRISNHAECLRRNRHELLRVARQYAEQACGRAVADRDGTVLGYVRRLWTCVEYHWQQYGTEQAVTLVDVLARLENGERWMTSRPANLLFDVALAEALEQREATAAAIFDVEYMPTVRATALRVGGQRGVEQFENFAAELILPRGERPPRIASFQGRTPLTAWLRAVVTNALISERRRKRNAILESAPEPTVAAEAAIADEDDAPCETLLQPVFFQAVGQLNPEDRLLLKLLILDRVPQHAVARSLGVHSGTLTRRRQHAATTILENVRHLAQTGTDQRRIAECLELLLTNGRQELRQRLADVLAEGVRSMGAACPPGEA